MNVFSGRQYSLIKFLSGAFESAPAPTIIEPKPRTAVGLGFNGIGNSTPTTSRTLGARPSTNSPSRAPTPISSPPLIDTASWDSPEMTWDIPAGKSSPAAVAVSMSGMSKEEKAAEMARRKEERKQVGLFLCLFSMVTLILSASSALRY